MNETVLLNLSNQTILRLGFLNNLDNISRCILLGSHVFYFVLVLILKEFQNVSYFNVHHINLIGLFTGIHYCVWINKYSPFFINIDIIHTWCTLAEACWAILKYARTYSILVLALYRYLTVFKENKSYKFIYSFKFCFLIAFSVWLISALIYFVTKYVTNAEPGLILCFDGYSSTEAQSIIYFIVTSLVGLVLPILIEICLYFLIFFKLRNIFLILGELNTTNKSNQSSKEVTRKHKMILKQTVIISCLEVASVVFVFSLNVCSL